MPDVIVCAGTHSPPYTVGGGRCAGSICTDGGHTVGADTAPAPAAPPLTLDEQVQATITHAGKILRAYGFGAVADLAAAKVDASDTARSVVVVGEVKRGKSLLVNALLGTRDASPVDVDVATSASLHFVAADAEHPVENVELCFPGTVAQIPRTELADWVTYTGSRVRDRGTESLPTRAIVPIPAPRLPDTIVVDTPGAGGLDAAHAQLALQSAQQACVLVVVCDATTPLTAPEMAFIKDATATVESVVVAVTKTDKNLRRWKPIVEENRRLLTQHLSRTVPVLGVSSVRALAAVDVADPARRANAETASGIVELRTHIGARLDLGEHQQQINGLRTAREGLRKVREKIDTDLTITEDSAKALPELTERRDRLQELKDHSGQWELHLTRDMTFARQAALAHLDSTLDDIRIKWTNRINKSGMEVLRKNSQVFTQEIEADLLGALTTTVEMFLARVDEIVTPLFDSEAVSAEIRDVVLASMSQPEHLSAGEVASKRQGLLDPTVLSMGMMGTSMLGALLGVGAIAGVVWIRVNLGYNAMKAGKHNLIAWLRETLGVTKSAAARMLEAAMTTSRTEIVLRYRDHLRARIDEVQTQLSEAKEAERLDTATRQKTVERLNSNIRVVDTRTTEIDTLIARLSTANAAAAQPITAVT